MSVKLLTEHHLEFLCLKEAAQYQPCLHLSKCHIVGNHMSWLIYIVILKLVKKFRMQSVDVVCCNFQYNAESMAPDQNPRQF